MKKQIFLLCIATYFAVEASWEDLRDLPPSSWRRIPRVDVQEEQRISRHRALVRKWDGDFFIKKPNSLFDEGLLAVVRWQSSGELPEDLQGELPDGVRKQVQDMRIYFMTIFNQMMEAERSDGPIPLSMWFLELLKKKSLYLDLKKSTNDIVYMINSFAINAPPASSKSSYQVCLELAEKQVRKPFWTVENGVDLIKVLGHCAKKPLFRDRSTAAIATIVCSKPQLIDTGLVWDSVRVLKDPGLNQLLDRLEQESFRSVGFR